MNHHQLVLNKLSFINQLEQYINADKSDKQAYYRNHEKTQNSISFDFMSSNFVLIFEDVNYGYLGKLFRLIQDEKVWPKWNKIHIPYMDIVINDNADNTLFYYFNQPYKAKLGNTLLQPAINNFEDYFDILRRIREGVNVYYQ